MTPTDIDRLITAALSFLPAAMDSKAARVMLMAIGMQESRFKHRRQVGGPAHGFWQFEMGGGIRGVMTHKATSATIRGVLERMRYPVTVEAAYNAVVDNDIVAGACARLLLYSLPTALPVTSDDGWDQYIKAWRPGTPHPETWADFYAMAEAFYYG